METLTDIIPAAFDNGKLDKEALAEWGEAYQSVAEKIRAYGLRNPLLIHHATTRVLKAVQAQPASEAPPVTRAQQELGHQFAKWFDEILPETSPSDNAQIARGHLALLLCDAAERWPESFLAPSPYDPAFLEAIQQVNLVISPDLTRQGMVPAELSYLPATSMAGEAVEQMARWPVLRLTVFFTILLSSAILLIFLAR